MVSQREIGKAGITAKVLERLRKLGCAALKIHGSPLQPAAVDVLAVAPGGRSVALEVKRPGQAATPRQARFLAVWGEAGAVVGTVHSADEAEALLREAGCVRVG